MFIYNIHYTSILYGLTVGEMPEHKHNISITTEGAHSHVFYGAGGNEGGSGRGFDAESNNIWSTSRGLNTSSSGAHTHTGTISNIGSNQSHNNMQPYYVCYMWRRTV